MISQEEAGADLGDPAEQTFKYSIDAPKLNLQRPRAPLPCYLTSADDYGKSVEVPLHSDE